MTDVDLLVQIINLILFTTAKLHCPCKIIVQSLPLVFLEDEEKLSEQKISFKGDGYGRCGNGAKVFSSLFHCWYYNPVAIFSLCLLSHVYHVAFQLVKKVLSLDVNVVFFVYMEKLVFINSYSNQ